MKYNGCMLNEDNLENYIYEDCISYKILNDKLLNVDLLLQDNYGKELDCSLTSITAVVCYYLKLNPKEVYVKVKKIADKYLYNGDKYGTLSVVIEFILNNVCNYFGYKTKCKTKNFKNIFYCFNTIKKYIDKGEPIILSLYKDGRNYYYNHTVTIIGYKELLVMNNNGNYKKKYLLKVADNWSDKYYGYIDYDKLSIVSNIVFNAQ